MASKALSEAEKTEWLAVWETEYTAAVEREGGSDLSELIASMNVPEPAERTAVPEIPLPVEPSPTFGGTTG